MGIQAQVSYLCEAARWAPSADNSQPWRLSWDGEGLAVRYDTARVQNLSFPPESPATLVAMGALLENLHQAAQAAEMDLESGNRDDAYSWLGVPASASLQKGCSDHPLFDRHTNRFPFRTDSLPTSLTDWLLSQNEGGACMTVLSSAQQVRQVARLVGQASEIRFQTQEVHEALGRSLRFSPQEVAAADGLDVATLHLPPGGRALLSFVRDWQRMRALNRLGAYKFFAGIEARSFANTSAVLAVVGSADRAGSLDAGRLLQRAWIELNRRGLAVHPFYVVADQLFRRDDGSLPPALQGRGNTLAEEAATVFDLHDRKLYMLLRVGYPTRTPVRSRRLPLEAISAL